MIDITGLREDKRPQSSTIVHALLDRLEAAEKSDAESIAMYRKARDERDALRVELNEIRYGVAVAHDTIKALRAKIEAAEKERDECNRRRLEAADHFAAQTALMKKKYDDLRAKIEAMERQEPVAWTVRGVAEWVSNGDGTYSLGGCLEAVAPLPDDTQLYALPGAQAQPAASVPSDEYVGWYCAHCERGVDASEVTYHEQHQACGRVITDDRPPRHSPSVPDSILADAARYRFLRNGGAYLEPNEGEIYMATDYGAKYYKDLRDLDMDIDEALAAAPKLEGE